MVRRTAEAEPEAQGAVDARRDCPAWWQPAAAPLALLRDGGGASAREGYASAAGTRALEHLHVIRFLASDLRTSLSQRFFLRPRTTRPTKPRSVATLSRLQRMSQTVPWFHGRHRYRIWLIIRPLLRPSVFSGRIGRLRSTVGGQ